MREAQLRHACRFAVLVLVLDCAPGTHAQTPARVQWSLRAESPTALRAGTEVPITLVAAIEPGWHIYSLTQKSGGPIPLTISVPAGDPFVLSGAVTGPKPEIENDATVGIPIELHSGTAEFRVPLKLLSNPANVVEGRIAVRYQACSNTLCLPPRSTTLPVRLQPRTRDGT